MSEEKIINGIDVSECKHHYTNPVNGIIYHGCSIYEQINELGYSQDTLCEQNPDCYFKQFKRLQEKNEELNARLKTLDDEVLTIEITPDEFERYKNYKQALEEIRKEYTNSIFYQCDKTEEECPCHNCIILGQLDRVQNIVKIIDEVLNDRD